MPDGRSSPVEMEAPFEVATPSKTGINPQAVENVIYSDVGLISPLRMNSEVLTLPDWYQRPSATSQTKHCIRKSKTHPVPVRRIALIDVRNLRTS